MKKQEKIECYEQINAQLKNLLTVQNYTISNLSNASALLMDSLAHQIFTGFYLYNGEKLILAPFQGSVSCVEIEIGKGVCGEAAEQAETIIVDNVKEYKNYISCDSRAMSEIVVPIIKDEKVIAVLDLDADCVDFYDEIDKKYLEEFVEILTQATDFKFFELF
ncbi:MAG: GAF domain-containing protein [Lactovum sp.]